MKKIFLGLALLCSAALVNAQNGLEALTVEKYYVSNATDAAGSVGALPTGSVTYRFFVDLLPGYTFQAAYAVPGSGGVGAHPLFFTTSTTFFNNEDRGATTPTYTKTQARSNSVMLDSWISVGGVAAGNVGVLKSEDDGVATVVNNSVPQMLQNANASAGIALSLQDGYLLGTPGTVTTVGTQIVTQLAGLDATSQAASSFSLTDGAWSNLTGSTGPLASNRICIAQITTDGVLDYKLNIQVGVPAANGGGVQRFVADNAVGAEIAFPTLAGTLGAPNVLPTVSITSPANGASFITGSTVNIAATAADAGGSIASVAFFIDGVLLSTDNTAPYTASYVPTIGSDAITAVATDNEGGQTTSTAVNITVANNPPPSVAITAPTTGASFITGAIVNITATATDNGSVTGVEFLVDGVVISTDNTSPYTATYTSTLGGHVLTARATDNLGLSATSAAVNITVVNNVPPSVTLTSPLASALFTAPAVVNITANVADSDGTIALVEFLVNGTVVNSTSVGSSPYSFAWTSTPGIRAFSVRATDNNGGITTSNVVTLEIADPNALPYRITSSVNTCNATNFCLPIRALNTVSNVIGYDITVNFDNTKVAPAATNTVTVLGDLINPSFVEVGSSVDQAAGTINIYLSFNGTAPAATRFSGTGDLLCINFNRLVGSTSTDVASFSVPFLQESYFTGVQGKLTQSGTYETFRDTAFNGKLKLWSDNSAIGYNAANPNQFLITNIRGNNATGTAPSATLVQPNTLGEFKYSTNNGLFINIEKDILSNTDVQAVVNGFDALLARRILLNDASFLPNVNQIVAADVNLDGVISAGDISQINQRAVLFIPEFRQAWNYNAQGVSDGRPSKDWLFIDSARVVSNPLYTRSTTYPASNGTGFNKSNVPQVPFNLPVVVSNFAVCPEFSLEFYNGVLIGDVNGNVATANPSNLFRDEANKVIFNLNQAVYANNTVEIPVSVLGTNVINSVDFALQLDESKLSFNSINNVDASLDAFSHFNTEDRTVRFTSNNMEAIQNNAVLATLKLNIVSGNVSSSDIKNAISYLNGDASGVEFVGDFSTGINAVDFSNVVSVFPNPANEYVQVLSPESANIQLLDAAGRLVLGSINAIGGQTQTINTSDLSAGVYFVRIANDNFSVMKKIVLNK
jgi:hypothetical protein